MRRHHFSVKSTLLATSIAAVGFAGFVVLLKPGAALGQSKMGQSKMGQSAIAQTPDVSVQARTASYSDIGSLEMSDLKASVNIVVSENPTVEISYTDGIDADQLNFDVIDGLLKISGPDRISQDDYREVDDWRNKAWRNRDSQNRNWRTLPLSDFLAQYPVITVSVPEDTAFDIERSIAIVTSTDGLGHVGIGQGMIGAALGDILSGSIEVSAIENISIGDVRQQLKAELSGSADFSARQVGALDIILSGSGDMIVGNVSGPTKMVLSGSGDIDAGNIQDSADFVLSGSGNIELGSIGGDIKVLMNGSGNIDMRDVDGALDILMSGSGNLDADAFSNGALIQVSGSGNIDITKVNGVTRANISGSGNIDIESGLARDLTVKIYGNGRFTHNGTATNLDAAIFGNGSIEVRENTGTLTTDARNGWIRVNGTKFTSKNDSH